MILLFHEALVLFPVKSLPLPLQRRGDKKVSEGGEEEARKVGNHERKAKEKDDFGRNGNGRG